MTKVDLQTAHSILNTSPALIVILLSSFCLSLPTLAQAPGPKTALPDAPSARPESSGPEQSNTSRDRSHQAASIEAGKETLTEQADHFVPMTNRERWNHYLYSLAGPQAVLYSSIQAGLNQARNTPHEWGQGAEGYGRRIGSAYAQHAIGATVGNGIAFALREDNRYFKSGKNGLGRVTYAVASAFLARRDDSSRFISFSAIGGDAAGAFISREWQPHSTSSFGDGAVSFGYAIGVRAGMNIVREFLPSRLERFLK